MYEFWYDYIKPKYVEKARSYYMDTDRFIVHAKTEDIYKDIAKDVKARFGTSIYEIDRPLPMGKNEKVIELIKDDLKENNENNDGDKKVKGTKKCHKRGNLNLKTIKNV